MVEPWFATISQHPALKDRGEFNQKKLREELEHMKGELEKKMEE